MIVLKSLGILQGFFFCVCLFDGCSVSFFTFYKMDELYCYILQHFTRFTLLLLLHTLYSVI